MGYWLHTLILSCFTLSATAALASSSIFERVSYSSSNTFANTLGGVWGAYERASINGSFSYAQTPLPVLQQMDTFYQSSLGASFSADKLAFDLGVNYSKNPLARLYTIGGTVGVTFIYYPLSEEEKNHNAQSMQLLHYQIYEPGEKKDMPLFWMRAGYIGNVLKSRALPESSSSGQETSFTFDVSVPFLDDFVGSLSLGFFGYDDTNQFFTAALSQPTTLDQAFLGSTISGLPKHSIGARVEWQISPLDTFIPKYQATENSLTGDWSHTGGISWRHFFRRKLYFAPSFEETLAPTASVFGFSFDFIYLL